MNTAHITQIAADLGIAVAQIQATATLLADGASVPFVARYRKEATGALDEVAISAVRDRMAQLAELDKRHEAMLASLSERGLFTDTLAGQLAAATTTTMTALEDRYLPYRPKLRTRATIRVESYARVLVLEMPSITSTPCYPRS